MLISYSVMYAISNANFSNELNGFWWQMRMVRIRTISKDMVA